MIVTETCDVMNSTNESKETSIQRYYSGKNVFLTGATGFMGKVLIEKLLRTCPDVNTIYMLMRSKKGKDIEKRFEDLFEDAIFDKLRDKNPKFTAKAVPISGDVSFKNLGLSEDDRKKLCEDVHVVFHAAATVRFDEKLRIATAINVQGTTDLLAVCKKMANLQAVIHLSTAYSFCPRREIHEEFYPPPIPSEKLVQCVGALDDQLLESVTPILLNEWPNTYAFTKAVAEEAVQIHGKGLPIAVFRPSIVLATWKEPVSGWTDNYYGPTGVVVGAGLGILRTLQADQHCVADLVPVDLAVSALIATAWEVATTKRESYAEIPIYNYVSSSQMPITWGRFMDLNYKHGVGVPSMRAIWYYTLTLHRTRIMHQIYSLFLHMLPALIVDATLFVIGKKPQMVKVYQKIAKFSDVIAYFSTRQWKFTNGNVQALWRRLEPKDQQLFNFNMAEMDWDHYFRTHIYGLRTYLGKDHPSTLPAARKRWFRFKVMHRLIQIVFVFLGLKLLWAVFSSVLS